MGGNKGPAEARQYDVLYDPLYTVSGARDYYKQQAQSAGYTLEKVPNFPNFFSEVPTFPAQSIRLKPTNDIPPFVPRDFRPDHPAPHELQARSGSGNVSGANLVKFLHQPLMTRDDVTENRALSTVKFATPTRGTSSPKSRAESRNADGAPKSVTVGTQSDYRESEAQTVPYTPDYVIPEGAPEPEILGLRELTYGSGLPAGAVAVALVDKMRLRREFEATLPPLSGTEQELAVRKRMMEAWERQEWADREANIAQAQEDRLASMVAAIEQREAEREAEIKRKMEGLRATKDAERSKALATIQKKRIQTMRKLTQARTQGEKGLTKRDIIEDYAEFGSRVYAPITRAGAALTAKGLVNVNSAVVEPASLQGVAHLEQSLARKTLPRVTSPQSTKKLSPMDARAHATERGQLAHIDNLLQTSKTMSNGTRGMGDAWPCPLDANEEAARLARTRARAPSLRLRRKPTGRVAPPVENEEQRARRKRRRAVIFLQSLIRGRATQAAVFETRARLQILASELQAAAQTSLDNPPGSPAAPVTLDLIKDKMLGAVLGDLMSALTVGDVAQRRAKLQEIEATHVENQARIQREEQEAQERMLRAAEPPPEETLLGEEKENMADGGASLVDSSKKHGHHKNGDHRHGKHGHKRGEHVHKHREHAHGDQGHKDKPHRQQGILEAYEQGERKTGTGRKHGRHGHKHGVQGHRHRTEAQIQGQVGGDTTAPAIGGDNPTRSGIRSRGSENERSDGDGSFRSGGAESDETHPERESDADSRLTSQDDIVASGKGAQGSGQVLGFKSKGEKRVESVNGKKNGRISSDQTAVAVSGGSAGKNRRREVSLEVEGERTEGEDNMAAEQDTTGLASSDEGSDGEGSVSGSESGSWTEGYTDSAGSYSDEEEGSAEIGDEMGDEESETANSRPTSKSRRKRPPRAALGRSAWAGVDPVMGDAAATRIQANFRGHQDRQLVARMKQGERA